MTRPQISAHIHTRTAEQTEILHRTSAAKFNDSAQGRRLVKRPAYWNYWLL